MCCVRVGPQFRLSGSAAGQQQSDDASSSSSSKQTQHDQHTTTQTTVVVFVMSAPKLNRTASTFVTLDAGEDIEKHCERPTQQTAAAGRSTGAENEPADTAGEAGRET